MRAETEWLTPPGCWRVDLHTHTRASRDCLTEPAALINRARAIGLDRVAVTDHNTIEGALAAHRLAPELVIVGEEIRVAEGGELIAYFVRDPVPPGLPVEVTIARLREQDAVISVPHPLDRYRPGAALGETTVRAILDRIDALEVFNARCLAATDNRRAAMMAARYGKMVTAGSDAHTLDELGAGFVVMPSFADGPDAFRESLAMAKVGGRLSGLWPHFASTYAKYVNRRLHPT